MHIAIIGASNSISAISHVIDRFGESYGLSKSRILEKYYEGLLDGYKVNPAIADPYNLAEVQAKLNNARLFSIQDMHVLKTADIYMIDGTFGGTAHSRTFCPTNLDRKRIRPTMMNFMNTTVVELAGLYGKRVIVTESATLSRIRGNYLAKHYKRLVPKYYRMGMGSWIGGLASWCKPVKDDPRLERFLDDNTAYSITNIRSHKWSNHKDGFVLLIASLEHDPTHTYTCVSTYVLETIKEIKKHTNRKIVLKPHPESEVDFSDIANQEKVTLLDKSVHLIDAVKGCYCAVMDDSTSLFQLVNLGIPCITSRLSFGAHLGNCDISGIEDLNYPASKYMLEWYRQMAFTEFRHEEFGKQETLKYVRELIDG